MTKNSTEKTTTKSNTKPQTPSEMGKKSWEVRKAKYGNEHMREMVKKRWEKAKFDKVSKNVV